MALLTTKQENDLPDDAFAYIEKGPGIHKDAGNKTVPRSARHFPIHDTEHVRAALSRIAQGAKFGDQAKPKVMAAAKKFKVDDGRSADPSVEQRRKNKGEKETRIVSGPLELRDDGSNIVTVTGYAIRTGVPYKVYDGGPGGYFHETMRSGVAAGLLAKGNVDCKYYYNHSGMVLGRSTAGTLRLKEDARGLHFEADLDTRSSAACDLAVAVSRGDVSQCSVGFRVAPDGDVWDARGENREIVRFAELLDCSAVAAPASPSTSVSVAGASSGRMTTAAIAAELRELEADRPARQRREAELRRIELANEVRRIEARRRRFQ